MPFLGQVVSAEGISVDPDKTAAVQRWEPPDSVREVQSFLGFANWFRMYIPGYSQKIAPLTHLTRKGVPFIWTSACQSCFDWLKGCLQQPPVLALPDFEQQFEVRADASSTGVGAVFMQGGRPLACESASFDPAERNYTIGEQELLAVVFVLRKWRTYLEGYPHPVRIVTDHMPLTYLPTKGTLGPRQVRWSEYLSRFHLEWVHTAGKHNIADVLSRMPSLAALDMTRARAQSQAESQAQVTPMPTSAADSQAELVQTSPKPHVNVTMANSDTVATQQRCNVQLRIQERLLVLCCYIMPLPEHIGIILSQGWHKQHQVVTNWATMTCEVFHRNKQHVFTQLSHCLSVQGSG